MPLKVEPLTEADLDILIHHPDTCELPGDDLTAPPCPVSWPVSTRAEAQTRARHHFAWQRRRLLGDPTINFMKVVDDDGEIVAVARWHYYPQGYDYESNRHWEMAPATSVLAGDDETTQYPPPNFNLPLHNHILTTRDSFRPQWIPREPAWILMHLVTRPSQRRRGAATLLIRWGQEQAKRTGAAAYLEAGAQGAPVYSKYGFQPVGEMRRIDLREFGPTSVEEFTLVNMRWSPGANGGGGDAEEVQESQS